MKPVHTHRFFQGAFAFMLFSLMNLTATFGQFTFTPQAGLNINWIKSSSEISGLKMESATYTSFGGRFGYILLDKIEIEVGVLYNQRGGQMINSNPGADDEKLLFKYLDIQPQVEYKLWDQLGVYAGGYYGAHIRSDRNVDGDWEEGIDEFKEADMGISVGLRGYLGRIFLQGQYDIGLVPVGSRMYTDANGTTSEVEFSNRTFQFAVGYHFVF